jgi:hypothetical protein
MNKVGVNQSIYDIALQYCGDVTAASAIAKLNNIAPSDDLVVDIPIVEQRLYDRLTHIPGINVILIPNELLNKRIVQYYSVNGIAPASSVDESFYFSGIDFWGIEFDFIVS